jgi:hypothetical protein
MIKPTGRQAGLDFGYSRCVDTDIPTYGRVPVLDGCSLHVEMLVSKIKGRERERER